MGYWGIGSISQPGFRVPALAGFNVAMRYLAATQAKLEL
jgi:hypothetical protein